MQCGQPFKSAIISLSRDIVCFVPLVIILPQFMGITGALWAAPIADLIGIIIAGGLVLTFLRKLGKNQNQKEENATIITIAREHGSQGKYIGELVAKELNIPYHYKEMTALVTKESGLDKEFVSE